MTKDFSTNLKNVDGTGMRRTQDPTSPVATIGDVVADALLATSEADRNLSGEEKNARYKLWRKIDGGGEKSISVEEAAMIKKVVGNAFGPLVLGQVWEFLEEG